MINHSFIENYTTYQCELISPREYTYIAVDFFPGCDFRADISPVKIECRAVMCGYKILQSIKEAEEMGVGVEYTIYSIPDSFSKCSIRFYKPESATY